MLCIVPFSYTAVHFVFSEHVAARFGSEDLESYAVFTVEDNPGDSNSVSMFVRTRRSQGLLLVLSNTTSQYLRVWLEDGKVKVQINNFESLLGRETVSDGHFHLITVLVEPESLSLFMSAKSQGRVPIRSVLVQAGDAVHVGGLPNRRASLAFGGYFKGCIQDLRMNRRRLQFYPVSVPVSSYRLQSSVKVMRGCTGDDSCTVSFIYRSIITVLVQSLVLFWPTNAQLTGKAGLIDMRSDQS